jgi:hypothetical protein
MGAIGLEHFSRTSVHRSHDAGVCDIMGQDSARCRQFVLACRGAAMRLITSERVLQLVQLASR